MYSYSYIINKQTANDTENTDNLPLLYKPCKSTINRNANMSLCPNLFWRKAALTTN